MRVEIAGACPIGNVRLLLRRALKARARALESGYETDSDYRAAGILKAHDWLTGRAPDYPGRIEIRLEGNTWLASIYGRAGLILSIDAETGARVMPPIRD